MLVANKHLDDPGRPRHGIIPWKNIFISLKLTKNVYIWIITVMHVYMFSMIKDLTQSAFLIFFSKVIGTKIWYSLD